jgi:hypothetical protein
MPFMKYFVYVGSALVLLLLVMNWLLPEPTAEPVYSGFERPVIRISSIEKLPEKVVIDTSMPYMVPPSSVMRVAPQPLQSAFRFEQITPGLLPTFSTLAQVTPKKTITAKRESANKVTTNQVAPRANIPVAKNYRARETDRDTGPPIKMTLLEEIAGRFGQIFKVN